MNLNSVFIANKDKEHTHTHTQKTPTHAHAHPHTHTTLTNNTQAVEKFQGVSYDVMDTDAKEFDEDFYAFRIVIRELERRLAAIIIQVC